MTIQQKTVLRWVLYSLLGLIAILLQTTVFSLARPFGLLLFLVPTLAACIAIRELTEHAALYALLLSLFWCLFGADCGSLTIVTLTAASVLCAVACEAFLVRGLLSALLLSLFSLLLVEGSVFAARLYLGTLTAGLFLTVFLPAVGLSLLFYPLFYWLTGRIAKVGA